MHGISFKMSLIEDMMNILECNCFTLRWRGRRWKSIIALDLRWRTRWWVRCSRWTVARCRCLIIQIVFNEINFRLCGLGRLGNWQFNLWLLVGFLHEHINQCFVLILRLRWNNWRSCFGRFRCFYENYLVMLLRWLNGENLRRQRIFIIFGWQMNEHALRDLWRWRWGTIRRCRRPVTTLRRPILLSRQLLSQGWSKWWRLKSRSRRFRPCNHHRKST